jgi:ankyrin repeat domain-containing protein 50
LKFLLTSRPYGGIRRGFQSLDIPRLPAIHLSGEGDVKEDTPRDRCFHQIQSSRYQERLGLRCDEQGLLLRELLRVPNRTYLWAHLTLDLIENDINIDKVGIVNATSLTCRKQLTRHTTGSCLEAAIPKRPREYYISL